MTHITAKAECPVCSHAIDAASQANGGDAKPRPGDLSMCFYCGSFLEFGTDLTLKELSLQALANLPDETRIEMQRSRRHWQKYNASRRSLGEDS